MKDLDKLLKELGMTDVVPCSTIRHRGGFCENSGGEGMKWFMRLAPFIVVEWMAKKWLERWGIRKGMTAVKVFDNVWLAWRNELKQQRRNDNATDQQTEKPAR